MIEILIALLKINNVIVQIIQSINNTIITFHKDGAKKSTFR